MKPTKKLPLFFISLVLGVCVNAQHLYVGANYHPHDDKNTEKIKRDIQTGLEPDELNSFFPKPFIYHPLNHLIPVITADRNAE
jgi:hypothetical protein